jgi:hypothetical protein
MELDVEMGSDSDRQLLDCVALKVRLSQKLGSVKTHCSASLL